MKHVWEDMSRTQLPSWVGPVPHNWGTAERGKLSADNWRVICTIHLPVTLIRLWGHETGRKKEILRNFMDLVTAVRIANMRVASPSQVAAYNVAITRYIAGLRELFLIYPSSLPIMAQCISVISSDCLVPYILTVHHSSSDTLIFSIV